MAETVIRNLKNSVHSLLVLVSLLISGPVFASLADDITTTSSIIMPSNSDSSTVTIRWKGPSAIKHDLPGSTQYNKHTVRYTRSRLEKLNGGRWTPVTAYKFGHDHSYVATRLRNGNHDYRVTYWGIETQPLPGQDGNQTFPFEPEMDPVQVYIYQSKKRINIYVEPLTVPQNLSVPPIVSGGFKIEWDGSQGNPTAYELQEQKVGANGYGYKRVYKSLKTNTTRKHTENILYYRVRACRARSCSGWSSPVTTKAIETPELVQYGRIIEHGVAAPNDVASDTFASNGSYDLIFGDSPNRSQAEAWVTYFNIYEVNVLSGEVSANPVHEEQADVLETESVYRVSFLNKAPGIYNYQIEPCNKIDVCGDRFTPLFPVQVHMVPAPPVSVSVKPTSSAGALNISWTSSSGAMVTHYTVMEEVNGVAGQIFSTDTAYNNFDTINRLSEASVTRNPADFRYKVSACNFVGCGNFSEFTPVATVYPPGSPTFIRAVSDIDLTTDLIDDEYGDADGTYQIEWDAVSDVPLSIDYILHEQASVEGAVIDTEFIVQQEFLNDDSMRVSQAEFYNKPQGEYQYKVRACMRPEAPATEYSQCGDWTDPMFMRVTYPPEGPPQNFVGTLDNNAMTVDLNWSAVNNATYYEVEQIKDNGDWQLLADVSGSLSRSISLEITGTHSYKYKVRACNALGVSGEVKFCKIDETDILTFVAEAGYEIETPSAPVKAAVPAYDLSSDTVGASNGSFRVNESGAATYDIEIATAAGTAGVVPKLNLMYTSQAGNGLVGQGWRIGGMSSIKRCRQTLAQDGNMQPIRWNADDRFCLDGQRLIVQGGAAYGSPGAIYKTEINNFSKVTSQGGTLGNPTSFVVERKDGSISYYGSGSNSNSKELLGGHTRTWAMNEFRDSVGNKILYTYSNDGNGFRPQSAAYAYGSGSSAKAVVSFNYEDRADKLNYYIGGYRVAVNKRLSSIDSRSDNLLLRQYRLQYARSGQQYNAPSRLVSFQECTQAVACLGKTIFDWNVPPNSDLSRNSGVDYELELELGEDPAKQYVIDNRFADINGDGKLDIIYITSQIKVKKRFLRKARTESNQTLRVLLSGNGGHTEILSRTFADSYEKPIQVKPFDYNYDGRSDLLIKSEGSNWQLYLAVQNGEGNWNLELQAITMPFNHTVEELELVDINGDGLADAIDGERYWLLQRNSQPAHSRTPYSFATHNNVTFASGFTGNSSNLANDIRGLEPNDDYFRGDRTEVKAPAGDFNGDGLGDFLINRNGGYQIGLSRFENNALTIMPATGAPALSDHTLTRFVDLNLDGLNDIIYWSEATKRWQGALSNGSGFTSMDLGLLDIPSLDADKAEEIQLTFADLDNDGFADIKWQTKEDDEREKIFFKYWNNATSRFESPVLPQTDDEFLEPENTHMYLDYNGDGYTDHVIFTNAHLEGIFHLTSMRFLRGGESPRTVGIETTAVVAHDNYGTVMTRITNGLGARTDLHYNLLSRSSAYSPVEPNGSDHTNINSPFENLPAGSQILHSDTARDIPSLRFNGQLAVLAKVSSSAPTLGNAGAMSSVSYGYSNGRIQAGGRGNLGFQTLTSRDDQTGIRTTTTYRQDWPFVGHPLKTDVRSPSGKILSSSSNRWAIRGYQSSWATTAVNSGSAALGSLQIFTHIALDEGYDLQANGSEQGVKLSKVVTTQEFDDYGNASNISVVTDGYDLNGVMSRLSTQVTDNDHGTSTYDRRMGRLKSSTVRVTRGTLTQERTSNFTYYTSGNLRGLLKTEAIQANKGNSQALTSTHFYDTFGNKTQVKTSGWDGTSNVTRLGSRTEYDYTGRYPVKTYQTFPGRGEIQTSDVIARNEYGTPTQVRDVNGNNAYTHFTKMGREFFSTSDIGSWSKVVLKSADSYCPAGTKTVLETSQAGGGRSKECFDVLGRSIRKLGIIYAEFDELNWVATDTIYDRLGRVVSQSLPFTITYGSQTNDLHVTTSYDLVGNPIRTVSPGGDHLQGGLHDIVSTISYSRFTSVTTNAKNQQKTEIKNVAGEILRVIDHDLATTKYSYDAHGNLTTMEDAGNNITRIIYDELGRKTSMSDPDKGNWVYEYNAFGELVRQTDAKGQIIETQYDLLGRETRRIDYSSLDCIEKVTDWTYDSQVYGLGQLAKVRSSDGHKEVPIYDNFGRSIRLITTLPGAGTFQTAQTFDHFGRPFQSFDASSRSVVAGDNSVSVHEANGLRGTQTVYNDLGYVKEIQNVRQYEGGLRIGFYQRNEKMDERGNVVKYVLGNGVEVNRDFYYTTGLIKQIDAQRPQPFNTAIQSLLYYWDDLGNLTGRTTLGEGDTDLLESFEYDSINRLDRSIVNYQGQSSYVDVTYDKLGNIKSKSDVGAYLYGGNGAGPHAVTSVGNTSYHYDNNGNNYLGDGRVLKYNAFDKVIEVTRGAYKTQFQYGPDRSRYLRIDADAGDAGRQASGKTTFYLGNVELIRHTAGARNGEVEYKRNLGVAIENILYNSEGTFVREKTEYLLHDHLGSVERIVSDFLGTGAGENVQLIQKMSFDPWGQRRNLQNYQFIEGDVLAAFDSSITTRGFTGHEMVDGVGIIHMNGRIYDGKIGRFLQADPFIQAPFDTQSLNRYSYVRNNPLNKTDPSGYFWEAAVAAVYWAVGTYVVADLLITLGAENVAALASVVTCVFGNIDQCAGAGAGSTYAFTYDFGKAVRAAGSTYAAPQLYGLAGKTRGAGRIVNAIANGLAGGILAEVGGGRFGDGFRAAGLSALGKGFIREIGGGAESYKSTRIAVRAMLGGTISELTGGKFANGAITGALAQAHNAETKPRKRRSLTAGEQALAVDNGMTISNVDKVRVYRKGYMGLDKEIIAPNGNIYIGSKNSAGLAWSEDYSVESLNDQSIFLHELVHVYQSRTLGCGRICMGLNRVNNSNYDYKIDISRAFSSYGNEEQAAMVQDRFRLKNNLSHWRPNTSTINQLNGAIPF